jgi:uncharacterized coiled-coil protein SlyX
VSPLGQYLFIFYFIFIKNKIEMLLNNKNKNNYITLLKLSDFKMTTNTNSSICFYIPRMLAGTREEDVKHAFADFGNVYRIDFTPQGKKPGFVENLTGTHKSAFVHFTSVFEKGHRINIWIRGGEEYKVFPYRNSSDEYWLLKPARSIMQDTMMNNAQIVSNCRALESKVAEQTAKIEQQSATIDELKQDLKGLQTVVQHLVHGLYCQDSQAQCINAHMCSIFEGDKPYSRSRFQDPDTHPWDSWPTTRQGDECERRLEALEKQLKQPPEEDAELQIVPITLRKVLDYDELFEVEDSDSDLSSLTEK